MKIKSWFYTHEMRRVGYSPKNLSKVPFVTTSISNIFLSYPRFGVWGVDDVYPSEKSIEPRIDFVDTENIFLLGEVCHLIVRPIFASAHYRVSQWLESL